ncbi:MAG: alcohol dehydrogenase [Chloroflexi bacterium]|nr:alcohol dehydrogenase [Chloroflexota bacterium]|tara:strand:+ start:2637 stop:3626 length:990 start_codon:yes stop_codon:yes gene_type:complete
MKAAWYSAYGAAREVLQVSAISLPTPSPGEVLVRVRSSGVNPSDWKSRTGSRGPNMPFPFIVPHSDGSGVIEDVGNGVDQKRIGQRVWLYEGQWQRQFGTAAEFIAIPSKQAVKLDDEVSFAEGACIGIPAMTAHRCLFANGPVKDLNVLVTGGAGAVGHYAIQLAKWGGAKQVITTVSSEYKASVAIKSGADYVVNYRTEDVPQKVLEITAGLGVDRIVEVDFGGNLSNTQNMIALNGSIGSYASTGNREPLIDYQLFSRKNVNVNFVLVYSEPEIAKVNAIEDITTAIKTKVLTHPIAKIFNLEQIIEAHELQESNSAVGNIVINMD